MDEATGGELLVELPASIDELRHQEQTPRQRIQALASLLTSAIEQYLEPEQIRPMWDRVLVKPLAEAFVSRAQSGLYTVSDQHERPWRYLVLAVGPGRVTTKGVREEISVRPKDVVVAGKYIGHPLRLGGLDFRLIKSQDILGVLPLDDV